MSKITDNLHTEFRLRDLLPLATRALRNRGEFESVTTGTSSDETITPAQLIVRREEYAKAVNRLVGNLERLDAVIEHLLEHGEPPSTTRCDKSQATNDSRSTT